MTVNRAASPDQTFETSKNQNSRSFSFQVKKWSFFSSRCFSASAEMQFRTPLVKSDAKIASAQKHIRPGASKFYAGLRNGEQVPAIRLKLGLLLSITARTHLIKLFLA